MRFGLGESVRSRAGLRSAVEDSPEVGALGSQRVDQVFRGQFSFRKRSTLRGGVWGRGEPGRIWGTAEMLGVGDQRCESTALGFASSLCNFPSSKGLLGVACYTPGFIPGLRVCTLGIRGGRRSSQEGPERGRERLERSFVLHFWQLRWSAGLRLLCALLPALPFPPALRSNRTFSSLS